MDTKPQKNKMTKKLLNYYVLSILNKPTTTYKFNGQALLITYINNDGKKIKTSPSKISNLSDDSIAEMFEINRPSSDVINNIPDIPITQFNTILKEKSPADLIKQFNVNSRTDSKDSAIVSTPKDSQQSILNNQQESITETIIKDYMGDAPTPFPSSSSKPSNDIDDINAETTPTSNVVSGNQDDNPKPISLPASKPIVNKNDQVRQDGNDPVIEAQITPASKINIDNPEPDYINIKTQQESKVDSNLQHDLSKQVRLQEMETTPQKDLPKNVNTDNQSNILFNSSMLETPVSKSMSMDAVNDQYVDILNKDATLLDAEVKNAINTTEEDVDTKLREFLTTYNPENIDYTSPDAVKQYALLTTHLLKQLNDKVEFIPSIDKGVKKVEKIQAEINQGNNITKAGKVEIPEDSNKFGLDAIYDKYITQGDMKYLPEDSYHPALVVGGLRRR